MGVTGLWQLLTPIGQPVTLESLENKILTVDISIWLNQAVKGYRDAKGGALPNAHLLSLFSRLCKLLFYKIRPIIVFDGGVPELKKKTVFNRQQRRSALKQSSKEFGLKLLANYAASNVANVTGDSKNASSSSFLATKSTVKDDVFLLPPLESISDSEDEELENDIQSMQNISHRDLKYLNTIDIESEDFNSLPVDIKQEILSTLKENRKHKSWEYYEALPKQSDEFSSYQMQCLLKRRKLQNKLEAIQREVSQSQCLDILSFYSDNQMTGEPIKIMSDDSAHYIYFKKVPSDLRTQSPDTIIESDVAIQLELKESANKISEMSEVKNVEVFVEEGEKKSMITSKVNLTIPEGNQSLGAISTSDCDFIEQSSASNTSKKIIETQLKPISDINVQKQSNENVFNINVGNKLDDKKTELNTQELNLPSCSFQTEIFKVDDILINDSGFEQNDDFKGSNSQETVKASEIDTQPEIINVDITESIDSPSSSSDSFQSVPDVELEENITYPQSLLCLQNITAVESSVITSDENESNELKIQVEERKDDRMRDDSTNEGEGSSLRDEISDIQLAIQEIQESTLLIQAEQAKVERQASTVQEHMIGECKDLLRLFGVPYIVSPMEAEAQCAFYDLHEISHGTITDDSDIWLFGGKRVYKNFFAQKKYVEFYKDNEVLSHFGLSRMKLINFAMLTGSDYTEGIDGVGPVTAMEIISEFKNNGIDALMEFKKWWEDVNKFASPPKNKVRSKLQKLVLMKGFPNKIVFDAYLNPVVDKSTESFSWGIPDLDSLREYCRVKFGWNKNKVDDALLPIIKRLNERTAQTHLDSFFKISLKKEKNLFPSKRITSALKKINPGEKEDECDDPETQREKTPTKRKVIKKTPAKRKVINKTVKFKSKNTKAKKTVKAKQIVQLSEESSSDSN